MNQKIELDRLNRQGTLPLGCVRSNFDGWSLDNQQVKFVSKHGY